MERIYKTIIAVILVPFLMMLCVLIFMLAVLLPVVAFFYPNVIKLKS